MGKSASQTNIHKNSASYASRRNGEANLVAIALPHGGMPYFVNSESAFAAGFPCARAVIRAQSDSLENQEFIDARVLRLNALCRTV
jgi:hypothetical protein